MLEFPSELMMGVLVASAAFCGLTGVVMSQIREKQSATAWRRSRALLLSFSFMLGVVAIVAAILWFLAPPAEISWLSPLVIGLWAFLVQIVLFVTVIVDFWLSEW